MVVISVGYLAILGLAALSLVVRTQRAMVVVDLLILVAAAVQVVGALILQHKPTDEGTLIAQAARSLLGGGEIYGVAWPQLFAQQHLPVTWMMGGGADYTLGYPPLAVLLTAPALLVFSFPAAASIVTTLVLLVGAFALWRLLPIDWRPGATIVMLGFPFMPHYARLGFPAIIAMVWLIPVIVRWPDIGRAGRLRRSDLLRAACLGAACATQQLAWFVAPFLLVGLFALRRGELPARRAFGTVASFAGVAGVTFLAINLPFIARDAPAWASGVALVLTQHAIPHGQGLIDVSFYLTDGSAELDFYSYATLLLAVGMLGVTAIWIRRLGPALTVIPWLVFYLSVRSQDGYFLLMTPLWLAAAATAPPSVFAHAWQPRISLGGATDRAPRVRRTAPPAGLRDSRPARSDPPRAVTPVRVGRDRERRTARACRREHDLAWAARAGPVADQRRCRERFDGCAGSAFHRQHGPGRHAVLERRRRPGAAGAQTRSDLSPDCGRQGRLCARPERISPAPGADGRPDDGQHDARPDPLTSGDPAA